MYPSYVLINSSTSPFFYNVAPGKYGVTIIDECGVKRYSSVNVEGGGGRPYEFDFNITDIKHVCEESETGGVAFTLQSSDVIAGNETIDYALKNESTGELIEIGSTIFGSGNMSFEFDDLSPAFYLFTIGVQGCEYSYSFEIKIKEIEDVAAEIIPVCSVDNPGSIELLTFNYVTWFDGSTSKIIEITEPGDYSVVVYNSTGCEREFTYTINDELVIDAEITQDVAPGDIDPDPQGSIVLDVTGGYPPYSYIWENESSNPFRTDLISGIYDVTVTDSEGCITSQSFEILECANVIVRINPYEGFVTSCEYGPGRIEPYVFSGNPPFTYNWTGPEGFTSNTFIIENLTVEGLYTLTVTDDCGNTGAVTQELRCSACEDIRARMSVDEQCEPNETNIKVKGISSGGFNGTGTYKIIIDRISQYTGQVIANELTEFKEIVDNPGNNYSPFEGGDVISPDLTDGLYRVRVGSEFGCSYIRTFQVQQHESTRFFLAGGDHEVCTHENSRCVIQDFFPNVPGPFPNNVDYVYAYAREVKMCGSWGINCGTWPWNTFNTDCDVEYHELEYIPINPNLPCSGGGVIKASSENGSKTWKIDENGSSTYFDYGDKCACYFPKNIVLTSNFPNQINELPLGSVIGVAAFFCMDDDDDSGDESNPTDEQPCPEDLNCEEGQNCLVIEGPDCNYEVLCDDQVMYDYPAEEILCFYQVNEFNCSVQRLCEFDLDNCDFLDTEIEDYDCSNPMNYTPCPCNSNITATLGVTCLKFNGEDDTCDLVLVDNIDNCEIWAVVDEDVGNCEGDNDYLYCECQDYQPPFNNDNVNALTQSSNNTTMVAETFTDELASADESASIKNWVNSYPNPFNDKITLEVSLKDPGEVQVRLIGLTGNVLKTSVFSGTEGRNEYVFDTDSNGQGIYFLTVTDADGETHYQKVTKITY